jgi:hypothetical protein
MKGLGTAALFWIAATLAVPAANAASVLIQSCKLPSGVTVVHNGHCDELKPQAGGEDLGRFQGAGAGAAPRAPVAGSERIALTRDAFFAVMNGTVNAECDNPKSKFTCMAKTPDVCRKTMPLAAAYCEKTMKGQMPEQITSKEEGQHWGMQLGQCVGNQFLVIAGSANLDARGCKVASEETNDLGSGFISLLRKSGVRR